MRRGVASTAATAPLHRPIDKAKLNRRFPFLFTPRSSNGRTAAFGAVNRGSNPCRGAILRRTVSAHYLIPNSRWSRTAVSLAAVGDDPGVSAAGLLRNTPFPVLRITAGRLRSALLTSPLVHGLLAILSFRGYSAVPIVIDRISNRPPCEGRRCHFDERAAGLHLSISLCSAIGGSEFLDRTAGRADGSALSVFHALARAGTGKTLRTRVKLLHEFPQ
jgi:hypothetical protein